MSESVLSSPFPQQFLVSQVPSQSLGYPSPPQNLVYPAPQFNKREFISFILACFERIYLISFLNSTAVFSQPQFPQQGQQFLVSSYPSAGAYEQRKFTVHFINYLTTIVILK